jgi:hypothetical protein
MDVLEDLKSFARANGLSVLAEHLDDAKLIAAREMALQEEKVPLQGYGETGTAGKHIGGLGQHNQA